MCNITSLYMLITLHVCMIFEFELLKTTFCEFWNMQFGYGIAPPTVVNFPVHRPKCMGTLFVWELDSENADIGALLELGVQELRKSTRCKDAATQ